MTVVLIELAIVRQLLAPLAEFLDAEGGVVALGTVIACRIAMSFGSPIAKRTYCSRVIFVISTVTCAWAGRRTAAENESDNLLISVSSDAQRLQERSEAGMKFRIVGGCRQKHADAPRHLKRPPVIRVHRETGGDVTVVHGTSVVAPMDHSVLACQSDKTQKITTCCSNSRKKAADP
jgi:hypothetical protein